MRESPFFRGPGPGLHSSWMSEILLEGADPYGHQPQGVLHLVTGLRGGGGDELHADLEDIVSVAVIAICRAFAEEFSGVEFGGNVLQFAERHVRNAERHANLDVGVSIVDVLDDDVVEVSLLLELDVAGLTIIGNDHTMTIGSEYNGTGYVINVLASDVTIDNVNIIVTEDKTGVYVIEAGNVTSTGFTFKNSSIKGEKWNADSETNASVAIGVNLSTEGTANNCEFTDCYTPIYVNASSVTLNEIKFNSGITFGVDVSAEKLNNLTLVKTENWDKANLDFTDAGSVDITDVRTKFADSGIEVRPSATV